MARRRLPQWTRRLGLRRRSCAAQGGRRRAGERAWRSRDVHARGCERNRELFRRFPGLAAELAARPWDLCRSAARAARRCWIWPALFPAVPWRMTGYCSESVAAGSGSFAATQSAAWPNSGGRGTAPRVSHGLTRSDPARCGGRSPASRPTTRSSRLSWLAHCSRTAYDEESIAAGLCLLDDSGPFDIGSTIGGPRHARRGVCGSGRVDAAICGEHVQVEWRSHAPKPARHLGLCPRSCALDGVVRPDTRLTHPNPVCHDASAAFVVALAAAVREGLDGRQPTQRASPGMLQHGTSQASVKRWPPLRSLPVYDGADRGHVIIALQTASPGAACAQLRRGRCAHGHGRRRHRHQWSDRRRPSGRDPRGRCDSAAVAASRPFLPPAGGMRLACASRAPAPTGRWMRRTWPSASLPAGTMSADAYEPPAATCLAARETRSPHPGRRRRCDT